MAETVLTTLFLQRQAETQAGGGPLVPAYFRIGEGGWQPQGLSRVPRTPLASQTDLDCLANPVSYPVDSRFVYQKDLSPISFSSPSPNVAEVACVVLPDDANNDGLGFPPEFYEIGLYTADGILLAYRTFGMQQKLPDRALRHVFRITNLFV